MKARTAPDKEEIRHAVRAELYDRQRTAHPAGSLLRHLRADGYDCDLEDIEMALSFLRDLGQVESDPDELGGTLYHRLTAAGILARERSEEL